MYYHLSNHIYISQFREELILLNTKTDKYTIFFEEFSNLLSDILEKNYENEKQTSDISQLSSQDPTTIQNLLDEQIIESKDSPYPFYIDKKFESMGVSHVEWRLPLENKKIEFNLQILKAFTTLIKVNYCIKYKGLYSAIHLIKKIYRPDRKYLIPQEEQLKNLANTVNKACLLYPTRTKCLEWAMTFVVLALKNGWKCNLEIGVQNYPFVAHAWVECDGKVVMDDPTLREGLAIILNEPFRKVRQ